MQPLGMDQVSFGRRPIIVGRNGLPFPHPGSPPAACFEFDLPEFVLLAILQMAPVVAIQHGPNDYEFFPASYPLLNQGMQNKQITASP